MNSKKQPERRTFLQDRFDILIKRQKSGKATFSELTELDEIVNRDADIREKVIRESLLMEGYDETEDPANPHEIQDPVLQQQKKESLLHRAKSLISRIFKSQISTVKSGNGRATPALLSC
jgi:hypothetical protein